MYPCFKLLQEKGGGQNCFSSSSNRMLGGEGVGVEMGPRRVHGIGSFPEKSFPYKKLFRGFIFLIMNEISRRE